jgi:hypothetical protein
VSCGDCRPQLGGSPRSQGRCCSALVVSDCSCSFLSAETSISARPTPTSHDLFPIPSRARSLQSGGPVSRGRSRQPAPSSRIYTLQSNSSQRKHHRGQFCRCEISRRLNSVEPSKSTSLAAPNLPCLSPTPSKPMIDYHGYSIFDANLHGTTSTVSLGYD